MNSLRMLPQGETLVAEAGNWGLYEAAFVMERMPSGGSGRIAHVTYQNLLPQPTEDQYISISEAHRISDISEKELIALCSKGILKAKKVESKWLILSEALSKYIEDNPNAPA